MSNLSVEELTIKSSENDELIKKLKQQIEGIKKASTPEFMAEKAKTLQKENEILRQQVEALKKDLEQAESKNPGKVPCAASKPTPVSAATETTAAPKKQETEPKAAKENKKQPAAPAKKEESGEINVSKLDIRIGKIVEVSKHPEADLLYVEKIDLGEGKLRNVCSGLVKYIPIEQMQDKMVVLICNLKPAKLKGVLSEAMVLCASTPEKVELIEPPTGAQIGDRVTAVGFEGEPAAECNIKNNIFGLVQPDLSTNDSLVATYKGVALEIKGKGPLKSSTLKNVPVK